MKGHTEERKLWESNGKVGLVCFLLLLSPVELGIECNKSLGMQILRRATKMGLCWKTGCSHPAHDFFLLCWSFQNSLQIIQSVPVVFPHPVALFDSCRILMYCVLLSSWSCKNIGQVQAINQSLRGCVFCGWLIIHCCSPWPILVFYN